MARDLMQKRKGIAHFGNITHRTEKEEHLLELMKELAKDGFVFHPHIEDSREKYKNGAFVLSTISVSTVLAGVLAILPETPAFMAAVPIACAAFGLWAFQHYRKNKIEENKHYSIKLTYGEPTPFEILHALRGISPTKQVAIDFGIIYAATFAEIEGIKANIPKLNDRQLTLKEEIPFRNDKTKLLNELAGWKTKSPQVFKKFVEELKHYGYYLEIE